MVNKYLIVIDMQKDFIYGSLGTKEAQEIVPAVVDKVKNFDGTVIFTQDTHHETYLETQEGTYLPVKHCILHSEGWELIEPLKELQKDADYRCYQKETFGSATLAADLKTEYEKGTIESMELIGVCTDICVISNALLFKAQMPELPICVHANCCAGVTPEKHEAALEVMRSCQIAVIQ